MYSKQPILGLTQEWFLSVVLLYPRISSPRRVTHLGGGGVLVKKLYCSFFNPLISLYIYYDQYEK